jgi:hypothetical protein
MTIPLADPPPLAYLVLTVLVVVAAGVAAKLQTRGSLLRVGLAVALLAGLFLCDTLAESPREEAVRRVGLLADAINQRSPAGFLAGVSDRFDYKGKAKAEFGVERAMAEVRRLNLTAQAWEFDRDKVVYQDFNNTPAVVIAFDGKATGPNGEPFLRHFTARFVRDPDGAYRLQTFTPYDFVAKAQESPIPGL